MKNLKVLFEKEDANFWQDTSVREPKGKRPKKLRSGKITQRMGLKKRNHRLRSAWE